jgi:Asp-tRNA(Asn)/Glu-tRNA(Gln) amidotransferase A subunit family amidase
MLLPALLGLAASLQDPPEDPQLTQADLASFAKVAALEFTGEELEAMLRSARQRLGTYRSLRERPIENSDPPATVFSPFLPGMESRAKVYAPIQEPLPAAVLPQDLSELYWADIPTLAALVRSRQLSCVQLAELFLDRLETLDGHLHCVISLRREQALTQAAQLDRELDQGRWRGLLHGIPWGAKDLLATRDSRTTWGAQPYREQVLDLDATVVERLEAAGAVLVAKLTLGALAMGDRWYGGRTRTPWDPSRGSSGSSAGSAAAVAAGGVPFAIGSETLGSIVSPSVQCGSNALRPTFGRVSRHGAMTLCWSMDKLGPMARSAVDLAIVFDAVQGPDGRDPSVRPVPFVWPGPTRVDGLRVGYPKGAFGEEPLKHRTLLELLELGVELSEVELPHFDFGVVALILAVEAASAFDDFTRDGLDDHLVDQGTGAWPNFFRSARMIPAVEFLRAQRVRGLLMREMDQAMGQVDVLVHPPYAAGILGITNLTGHPTFVAPAGFEDHDGAPVPQVICFTGQLDDDARLLVLAATWQRATGYEEKRPAMEWLSK